jgi:hypothetical protein
VITNVAPTQGPCGTLLTIFGHGFGSPPSTFGTQALISGPTDGTHSLQINGGSDTSMSGQLPSTGLAPGAHKIQVVNNGGVSGTVDFTVTGGTPGQTC